MATIAANTYDEQITLIQQQPQALEELYQQSKRQHASSAFQSAVQRLFDTQPDNQLLAAWYYRFQSDTAVTNTIRWGIATIIGACVGLLLWILSLPAFSIGSITVILIVWSPCLAAGIIAFLAITGRANWGWLAIAIGILLVATSYTTLIIFNQPTTLHLSNQEVVLLLHLPLIAIGSVAIFVIGPTRRGSDVHGFVWKGIETVGIAGVFGIVDAAFVGLIIALFLAINVSPNSVIVRLLAAISFGIIPIIAIAISYQPGIAPGDQDSEGGFAGLITIATQLLVPLSLTALILYLAFLPTNFFLVFNNRDSLIIYNLLLFGAVALIVAATPLTADPTVLARKMWLRRGIITLAGLVTLISLHALAAIIFRTTQHGVSINRAIIIGWNSISIVLLIGFLWNQIRQSEQNWVARAQSVYLIGGMSYILWGIIVLATIPWLSWS